jgi:alpha-beta hydrolase superfamily lysophospholipase
MYLADAGFDAYALDLQGYGNSSKLSVLEWACDSVEPLSRGSWKGSPAENCL